MRIGISGQQYPEQRTIIGRVPNAEYILQRDYYLLLRRLKTVWPISRIAGGYDPDLEFSFNDFRLSRVDLSHFFNVISFAKSPWISTFETIIPRYKLILSNFKSDSSAFVNERKVKLAIKALSSPSCKKLIAISHCNAVMQDAFLANFPERAEGIHNKTIVIHPPQIIRPGITTQEGSKNEGIVHLMLVGHQFFRKGGREILDVLVEGVKKFNWPIHLSIVSSLEPDGYATKTTRKDVDSVLRILGNEKWIDHYSSLPYEKVLTLMSKMDVGLLPSYADTYGYSVLEFQSFSVPVITTDCRAFPEINNSDVGWVISVPKDIYGEALHSDMEGRNSISDCIRVGLQLAFEEILENPTVLNSKGKKAKERVAQKHCPLKYGETLHRIYREILQ